MRFWRNPLGSIKQMLQRDLGVTLVAFSFAVSAVLIAASAATAWTSYNDTRARAVREAHGLLEAGASNIRNQITLWSIMLDTAARELGGVEDLGNAQNRSLAELAQKVGYVGSLLVLDRDGNIIADPLVSPRRVQNFADRDYFRVHVGRADVGTFISEPFRSRLRAGDPSIVLSQRLTNADGAFAGIVMIAVRLASVHELFEGIQLGPGDMISLISPSGRLLVRKPSLDGVGDAELDFSNSPIFRRMNAEESGSLTAVPSRTDGIERLFSFTRVPGTRLLLTMGLSASNVFANWLRGTITLALLTLVMCTGSVWLAFRLKRELERRTTAEHLLNELAATDALTGLPNRRRFDEMLNREWRRSSRTGGELSVLMIDADHFKQLNDMFGHTTGDRVLRHLADTITGCLRRPGDLGARYGGEEFAVILPDTSMVGATHIAERIVDEFRSTTADFIRPCTVSIGVNALDPQRPQSLEDLLAGADAALYRAKASGRDCVRAKEGESPPPGRQLPQAMAGTARSHGA